MLFLQIQLEKSYSFKIFTCVADIPSSWNTVAGRNIFLHTTYLAVLENASPENMTCRFIAVFSESDLVGVAVSQFINMRKVKSFGERDTRFKTKIRHYFFKLFGANVLFLGNNMLTGQNAFKFLPDVNLSKGIETLGGAINQLRNDYQASGKTAHLTIFKDFYPTEDIHFKSHIFDDYFKFSTQPNMVLTVDPSMTSFDEYLKRITKKYRDQYKRSRKKSIGIQKRKLGLDDIVNYSTRIHELYMNVANNAPFNTFYLPKNHFIELKQHLKQRFFFYGYFDNDELVGFSTLIENGSDIDTYFLGYDEHCQREKMLYLNMLYDMTAFSINHGYRKIIFARTALEIKSSVGAVSEQMIGFIRHDNRILNFLLPRLFKYFEPKTSWQQRHPFKD